MAGLCRGIIPFIYTADDELSIRDTAGDYEEFASSPFLYERRTPGEATVFLLRLSLGGTALGFGIGLFDQDPSLDNLMDPQA